MPYDSSTGFTTTVGFTRAVPVYQCDGREAIDDGNYWGGVPEGYTNFYSGRPFIPWKWKECSEIEGHVMTDWEPYILDIDSPEFRENDPFFSDWLSATRPIRETVMAMEPHAYIATQNGAKIGTYDLGTLVYRNINRVLNYNNRDFNEWARIQEKYAKIPIYNGLSFVDAINTFGGKFYYTCYVTNPQYDVDTSWRSAFRRYNKRLMSFFDGIGMDSIPLFTPVKGEGQTISDTLLLGLRDDSEAYQSGEWGVWGHISLTTQPNWTTFMNTLLS